MANVLPDDSVPVAAPTPATSPGVGSLIKTFNARDPNGNIVDIQAVVLVNEYGKILDPLSEGTGREIVDALKNLLAFMSQGDVRSTE
jgi:hypothetical protein